MRLRHAPNAVAFQATDNPNPLNYRVDVHRISCCRTATTHATGQICTATSHPVKYPVRSVQNRLDPSLGSPEITPTIRRRRLRKPLDKQRCKDTRMRFTTLAEAWCRNCMDEIARERLSSKSRAGPTVLASTLDACRLSLTRCAAWRSTSWCLTLSAPAQPGN